jgi:two-component system sensor histidine kinase/response regulator
VELEVEAAESAGGVVQLHFKVRDTGIGIPRDKHATIFAPFSQVDGSTTRIYGGTGLGLTISARLVDAMQGRIWLESELGKGSTFHFAIPVRIATDAGAGSTEDREFEGMSVLVVDDNLANRQIIAAMVRKWGMNPVTAAGATGALAQMRNAAEAGCPFGLVITDVHMPELDGFALVQRIHQNPELVRPVILMITSGEHQGDLARCREIGASAYLIKPVRQAELRLAIAKALAAQMPGAQLPAPTPRGRDTACRKPHNILLAEDNPVNQRVTRGILEKAGHRVTIACTGREALRLLDEQAFDIVFMDVQMPEMDGFAATRSIRRAEWGTARHLPIVAMTAHAMTGDRERCVEAGMDAYVSKPVNAQSLLDIVEEYAADSGCTLAVMAPALPSQAL